jgi:hypothetical protein
MKKLLVLSMVLMSFVSYGQNKIMVGGLFGVTQSLNSNTTQTTSFTPQAICIGCTENSETIYKNNNNYGLYVSFKKFGVLYSKSGNFGYNLEDIVSYNNPPGTTRYLGASSKNLEFSVDVPYENANIETQNFGFYQIFPSPIKRINYLGGIGFQTNNYHKVVPSTGGSRMMNGNVYPRWNYTLEECKKNLPSLIGGITINLNNIMVLNGLAVISYTSSFNIGVGIVID